MIEMDRLGFALVVALHNGDDDAASRLLHGLTVAELISLTVVLARSLDQAWIEGCEHDGVSFDEFVTHAGLWLAGS